MGKFKYIQSKKITRPLRSISKKDIIEIKRNMKKTIIFISMKQIIHTT